MCGIAGVIVGPGKHVNREVLERMTAQLAHRGPDGSGIWISADGRVGLGHRRLSIIDLSSAGAQPMQSASGRYVVSFNGEIYNFPNLRIELEHLGAVFFSHSDTEIILAACDAWGVEHTVARLAGMFALAIWDMCERVLYLARDRVGIKPLFYTEMDGALAFASELRALVVWRGSLPRVSSQGLTEFLRLGYVPGPISIFEGVGKLPPGTFVTFRDGCLSDPRAYWRLDDVVRAGADHPFVEETEALTALDAQLREAVASHMVSDVPLGAFLSGGIDSSIVVSLMQAQSSRPVKTFSIGFNEDGYNEAGYAAAVALYLGTEHTELFVTDADARAVIPDIPDIYDEPFADASQIPTYLVSRLARRDVTVALSGDGGDELFAGYNRYAFVSTFWARLQQIPVPLRRLCAAALAVPGSETWDKVFRLMGPCLPPLLCPALPGQKMQKVAAVFSAKSLLALHGRLVSQWANPELVVHSDLRRNEDALWEHLLAEIPGVAPVTQQMFWDMQTYLVDDILTKVDRASMRVGLEVRVPLLDHGVVELAWRIPLELKLRDGSGKWLLKKLLHRYVPRELVERPKMGFSVPIDAWLRGPLREWAETYLSVDRIRAEGFLDAGVVRQTWEEHLNGSVNRGGPLWTILMFQVWLERTRQWV